MWHPHLGSEVRHPLSAASSTSGIAPMLHERALRDYLLRKQLHRELDSRVDILGVLHHAAGGMQAASRWLGRTVAHLLGRDAGPRAAVSARGIVADAAGR